jgi:hypothetical protein
MRDSHTLRNCSDERSEGTIFAWVLANHVIHFLSDSWTGCSTGRLSTLTQEVHEATCSRGSSPA